MFSSVRYAEHIKNAIQVGAHACTIPWKVMKNLTDNHFTEIGTQQFNEHTRQLTTSVREVIRTESAMIKTDQTVLDALIKMTQSKLGAVTVLDDNGSIYRIFTDGDLRRLMESGKENIQQIKLSELDRNTPVTIDANETVFEANKIFKEKRIDNIIVTENDQPVGMIDVQDVLS